MNRTEWAEIFFENFSARPLVAECILRSPKRTTDNKEVCDHIFKLRDKGIIISLKCHQDPKQRSGQKLENWIQKATKKGLSQAKGALRTTQNDEFYCDHPRHGHVVFQPSEITIAHLLVVVEVLQIIELPAVFALSHDNVPISYISANEFLNIIDQLRAFPEIVKYLEARRVLSDKVLRTLGAEKSLYAYYLLNEESFEGFQDLETTNRYLESNDSQLKQAIQQKTEADLLARQIEHVLEALSERHPHYEESLDPETLERFDSSDNRQNYKLMQEDLCDLPLSDRRILGWRLQENVEKTRNDENSHSMSYSTTWTDNKPDFLYILVSSKCIPRQELLTRIDALLHAGLSFYDKTGGMVIADRDGESYEVARMANFESTEETRELGKELFGHLKSSDYPSSLLPLSSR